MEKLLISACLLGEKVRYDGKTKKLSNGIIQQWQNEQRLISICPEVSGGLSVPRAAAEIRPVILQQPEYASRDTVKNKLSIITKKQVVTQQNEDVSEAFYRGANIALKLCQKYKIRFALLKESSPSCGSTTIYDGSFTRNKIKGEGLTAELLRKNDIEVFSEENIELLIIKLAAI